MACKIGAITVGQSPRSDVVPEIAGLLGNVELIQWGALDGLTTAEIAKLAPSPGDYVLVTRLKDGTSVHIAKRYILERMQLQINEFIRQGADGILLLCTGEFPGFHCAKPVLYPQRLLQYFVMGTAADRIVGVATPDASQVPQATRRWQEYGVKNVVVEPATPYGEPSEVLQAAAALKRRGAEIVVMDCIGYTSKMKEAITELTGLPVILPRTVAARTVAEIFG